MKLTTILGVTMLTALGATSAQADHRNRELGYVLGGAIIGAAVGELIYDSRRGHRNGHGYYRYNSHSYGYDRYPRTYRSNYYRYRPNRYYRSRHHDRGHRRGHRRHRSYRH
jgi:hypothetical protein